MLKLEHTVDKKVRPILTGYTRLPQNCSASHSRRACVISSLSLNVVRFSVFELTVGTVQTDGQRDGQTDRRTDGVQRVTQPPRGGPYSKFQFIQYITNTEKST